MLTATRAIFAAVLVAYSIGSLTALGVYPSVSVDEPWIAAAPYKLATDGILGSDLFAGFAGMERRHYQHMPVYPVLEAGVFRAFGVGVEQMRLLSVTFGLLLLVTTFAVGRLIGDERVGLVAVLLLVGLRLTAGEEATGILLLDRARVNRYDIAVPVFGLLSFHTFVQAGVRGSSWRWFLAGLLAALASLSHLYGIFWAAILFGLLVARDGWQAIRRPGLWYGALGVLAGWAPWTAFILTGWADFQLQLRTVSDRFGVFSPSFYVDNVFSQSGPISLTWLAATIQGLPAGRIGSWTVLIGLPAAAVAILRHRGARQPDPARWLAVAGLAQTALFMALLRLKTVNYMIALWPMGALGLAWLGVRLWDNGRNWLRAGLLLLAAAVALEGGLRLAHARGVAGRMTPYEWYTRELARCIPAGSMVLGMPQHWLGLRQFPYRAWLLPMQQAMPRFTDTPIPFDAALERIRPDVILIDRAIEEMFAQTSNPDDPLHHLWKGFSTFSARHRLEPACVIRDPTYGVMQIYRIERPTG